MRILYIHQYFASLQSHAGTRSYEFARRFIAHGHEVCVITSPAHLPDEYKQIDKRTRTVIDGVPVAIIPVPYSNDMSFRRRIWAFFRFAVLASLEAMRHPPDVVFATSTPLTIAIPAIIARLRHRVPMVLEIRDLWPEVPITVGALKNPVARWLAQTLEWVAYHAAAHIVALSPGMAAGVMRRGIPASRVTTIPNSCDRELFDVPAERGLPIREKLGLIPDQPLVVYAGTFGIINGVDYLVDVADTMREIAPEVRFLLVGAGAKRQFTEDKARKLGVLDKNLWIWEPVPKTKLVDVTAASTITTSLFLPIKEMENNSANKFFDSLAAAKPIAINYGGWQADLLNKSGAGLVLPPAAPQQGARMLAGFVRDPARVAAASGAARELARTRFDRDAMAQQLETILREVAGA